MYYLLILLLIPIIIVHGQEQLNPSLILSTDEITYEEFNKHSNSDKKIKLDKSHSISWQISLANNLIYDSDIDAIIRFYDSQDENKFIEIGMGGPQQNKFWVGMLISDNQYLIPYQKLDRGWISDANIIITYTERAGLTVNNGERIVLSNLDIGSFSVLYYDLDKISDTHDNYITSGNLILEFMSGDPAQNPYHLFPFYLVGSIGCVVALLLIFTKRS